MSGTSAATYWNHNAAFHDEFVADAARRGGRALDVGCGEGLLVQRLAAVCEEAVGIEADPATVERARARLAGVRGAVVGPGPGPAPARRGARGGVPAPRGARAAPMSRRRRTTPSPMPRAA